MNDLSASLRKATEKACEDCIYFGGTGNCRESAITGSDCNVKLLIEAAEMIDSLEFELNEYRACGTVEECQSRKEWMELSLDDVRKRFINFCKQIQEQVELDRQFQNTPKKKRSPNKAGKRKYFRKCGVCGERYEQSDMIRTDNSPNGWICHECVRKEHPEYDIEEW